MTSQAVARNLFPMHHSLQKRIFHLLQGRFRATCATADIKFNSNSATEEWTNAKPLESIPGLRSFPIIGTMWGLLPVVGFGLPIAKTLEYRKLMYNKFGPIWRDVLPGNEVLVYVIKPEDVEKVFRSEGKFPTRPPIQILKAYREERIKVYTAGGIVNSNGEDWWDSRSKAQQPFLKTKSISNYVPAIGDIAQSLTDRIKLIRQENDEVKPDFINELYRWALESVALVAFDTRLGCLEPNLTPDSEAQRMIDAAIFSLTVTSELELTAALWRYFKTKKVKKAYEAQDFFTETTIKYIKQTIERINQRPPDSDEDSSILEDILQRGMSPQDAVATLVDLLIAGIDTTANTTGFLFYYLARNQDKQEILRQEILSVVGPKGTRITASSLTRLDYLNACVKETLRLRSAASENVRVLDRDLVLSGYRAPRGTMVMTLHHIPSLLDEYFPRANEFIPERWLRGHPMESNHHPYTLLPFGFGTRMCIGRRLAELEMKLLTAKVVQHFKIEYHHEDIGSMFRLVVCPDKPLRFRFVDLK